MNASPVASTLAPPRLAFWLACALLVVMPIPGLVDLPAGASVALLVMLASVPVWYATARARITPFDAPATRAISIVLAAAGFLILWSVLSAFGTDDPKRASRYVATLLSAFAFYFLVRGTITTKRLGVYVDILATGLAASAFLSLLAYEVGFLQRIIFDGSDRAAGLFKNPNQFGMVISTTLPALTAFALATPRRRKLRVLFLILMALGLIASGSKTNLLLAWPTVLITLCSYAIISYSGAKRVTMLAVSILGSIAAAAAGILALALLNPRALAILTEFLRGPGEVDSLTTRSYLWRYSLDQFLADPILGQGAGQRIDIFYRTADVSHSHNVLLDYMRTLGAPGLAGVTLMIGAVVVLSLMSATTALRSAENAPAGRVICLGLSLSSLSYVVANMSSDSFGPSTSPFFWLFTYMALASRNQIHSRSPGDVTLQQARALSLEDRSAAPVEVFPILEPQPQEVALPEAASILTFANAIDRTIDALGSRLSSDRYRKQWRSSLERYAVPKIGHRPVDEIMPDDVFSVLDPIWLEKHETARRVRGRIEEVLNWAKDAGYVSGENPARWKDNLDARLSRPNAVTRVSHHPALSQADVSDWFSDLRSRKGNATRALEFAVLTVARPDEVLSMIWSEVDQDRGLWIVPASRMNTSREFRVPLSHAALKILREQGEGTQDDLVFPAPRGGVLSNSALSAVMRRMHAAALRSGGGYFDRETGKPAVPFGLFSTFRRWVAQRTTYSSEIAEIALANTNASSVESGDQLDQRRQLMHAWAGFLSGEPDGSPAGSKLNDD